MSLERRRLRVEFSTEAAFRSEYLSNISNGGVFIATAERLEVRDTVVVELLLGWCSDSIELEGEVVHRIGAEMAETGAVPGVAIQFDLPARELRERFEPVVGEIDGNERKTRTGRRAAPRSPARINVRLQMPGAGDIECRTRDVSSTGLLISLDGRPPLAVGEEVGLVIGHPESGEEMQLNGAVVRHLETDDGIVTALGIEFRTSAARKTEVSSFMNDIRAAEHSRRLGGISGPIAELGIENLLQMFGASSPRGTLTVSRGVEEGVIVFEGGQLCSARLGPDTGAAAMREMLSWREGDFEFQAHVDEADVQGEGEGISLNGAILDALCAIDESGRPEQVHSDEGVNQGGMSDLADDPDLDLDLDIDFDLDLDADSASKDPACTQPGESPTRVHTGEGGAVELDPALLPPRKKTTKTGARASGARKPKALGPKQTAAAPTPLRLTQSTHFQVDTHRADSMRAELNKIEEAVLDLALVGMGVARMVEVIPEPELEVYGALDALLERGILSSE